MNLIARNARRRGASPLGVAQDQKEYNERYDVLVSRYEETEHKRNAIIEQIDQIMIRRRKIERFSESVKDLPGLLTSCASIRFRQLDESSVAPLLVLLPSKHVLMGTLSSEFDESLWAGLVDSMTVYDKDRIIWKLTCGDGLGPGEIEV